MRIWRKGNPLALFVRSKLVQPLWKIVWKFLKKINMELQYDPGISFLGKYSSEENGMLIRKRYIHLYVNKKIITIAKIWKQCKCSDEWINKMYIFCLVKK